jgi:hypothetical protein
MKFRGQCLQTGVACRENVATAASRISGVEDTAVATNPQFVGIAQGKDDCLNVGVDGVAYAGNYIFWLATSATGLSILFSIIATNVAKPVPSPRAGS